MWPRKKDPGEADTLGHDQSICAGRVWSVCSSWWPQTWRGIWSAPRTTQPASHMLAEEYIDRGQDKGPEAAKLYPRTQTEGAVREGLDTSAETNYSQGRSHMFHRTRYGSDELLGMKTKISRVQGKQEGKQKTIQALADSGASSSIISWDLAKQINMTIYEKGEATLKDGSHNHMDVSGIGAIMVQEDDGLPLKIRVLISRSLGEEELVVGLSDLKDMNILHKDFPRTLPEFRRSAKFSKPSQYNTMRGDQWFEQEQQKEAKGQRRPALPGGEVQAS